MYIATFQNANDFLARAEDSLLEREVTNGLILGIAKRLASQPDSYASKPYLATVEDGDNLLLAALMTPPFNLVLANTDLDYTDALNVLVDNLINHQWSLPGVGAPAPLAADFAHIWQEQTGATYHIERHERIFVLHTVNPPQPVPGELRLATRADLPTLQTWIDAFFKETRVAGDRKDHTEYTVHGVSRGDFYVWVLPDGQIVSLAGKTRPVVSVISIGPVYTPPEFRGKGYASNLVAALSQHLLDAGWKACSLFTDLANPVSNRIYLRIGYDPVIDFDQYTFE